MSKKQDIQATEFEKLIIEFIEHRNNAGFHLLKMAQTIAEAKHRLSRKMFKRFLKDPRINIKRLQANKMIAVYELSKSDSRLTYFINKEGIEKSYLITTIKDENLREKFTEVIIDIPFTVKQMNQAIQKIVKENKIPVKAIEEVQNKIGLSQSKPQKKSVSIEEFEKLKSENEFLRQKLTEFEKKPPEKPAQKDEIVKGQTSLALYPQL